LGIAWHKSRTVANGFAISAAGFPNHDWLDVIQTHELWAATLALGQARSRYASRPFRMNGGGETI